MAYKDSLNCLQIILGGKVHHREKFVVELAMLLSRIIITPDKMIEHLDMRVDVTSRVHRHETRELQESWINRSSHPSVGKGYGADAMSSEPFRSPPLRKHVDYSGAPARVDWATHQGH